MRLAFVYSPIAYGSHRKPIDFDDPESRPLTGTDLVSLMFPREMARRGHDVELFIDRGPEVVWGGVGVRSFERWPEFAANGWDAVIATSNPNALSLCSPNALRTINRQVAAFGACDCDVGWQSWTDLVLCPSRTAVQRVRVEGPSFDVLGNGVDMSSFPQRDRVPGRCLWISSPDRGLHWLLQAWPEIRRRAPHAHLRIAYESIGSWLRDNAADRPYHNPIDAEIGRRAQYVEHGLRKLAAHGVEVHEGGVSHRALAEELSAAECLLYPMDSVSFTETFGVAVLEASAAGCLPILSTGDAFGELWSHACPSVDAPVGQRIGEWTDLAVKALTDGAWREARAEEAKANAAQYAWPVVAEKLERLCEQHIERKKRRVHVEIAQPEPRGTIDMVLSPYASGDWPINPYDPFEAPLGGGCRMGFVLLTRGMAKLGWKVRAFSTWAGHDTVAGVAHRPMQELGQGAPADALLAYYDTSPLTALESPLKIASHHTYSPPFKASIPWADINVAPSRHAMLALRESYGGRGWGVLPNIVPPDLDEPATVPGRVLYHTSADRGLHLVVKAWPEIRALVPHATLHIVGPTEANLRAMSVDQSPLGERYRALLEWLPAAYEAGGVRFMGRLSRGGVVREIAQAACFAFPIDRWQPCETWSTSIVECMAGGVPVVLSPQDALGELWGDACVTTPAPAKEHLDAFIEGVKRVLQDREFAADVVWKQRERVAIYTAENAARTLDEMIAEQRKARAA